MQSSLEAWEVVFVGVTLATSYLKLLTAGAFFRKEGKCDQICHITLNACNAKLFKEGIIMSGYMWLSVHPSKRFLRGQ